MQYDLFGEPVKPDSCPITGKSPPGKGDGAAPSKNAMKASVTRAIEVRDWSSKVEPFLFSREGNITTILKIT
jgi:hypothetical protein